MDPWFSAQARPVNPARGRRAGDLSWPRKQGACGDDAADGDWGLGARSDFRRGHCLSFSGHASLDQWPVDLSYIVVSGNIEAHESILSFKTVQSRIVELPFDEGQSVKARTVLARVDDADYKQQVEIAQAALNAQKKQLDVAEQNVDATRRTVVSDEADVALKQLEFDRAQTLLTKGAGTVDARDVAETALKQSRAALERDKALEAQADKSVALAIANIDSARANLDLAKIVLGYTTLRAPFDGVILVRQAELGEVGSPVPRSSRSPTPTTCGCAPMSTRPTSASSLLGEAVTVTTDSYPGKEYPGRFPSSRNWRNSRQRASKRTPSG